MKIPEYTPPYTIFEATELAFERLNGIFNREYLKDQIRKVAIFYETNLQMLVLEKDLEKIIKENEV